MGWATTEGVRLYYERGGSGPPLLYITGTGGDLRKHPSPFDSPLAKRFDVVSYDQRGLGQSDQPDGPYSMAGYAHDAVAILDAVRLDRVNVIGVSFGGMVAQELAIRYPTYVACLALACTSSGGAGGASYPLHELIDLPTAERTEVMVGITDQRWIDPSFNDPLRELLKQNLATEGPATSGARNQLEARRRHDTFDRLSLITCPTLVCGGRYDGIAPPVNLEALTQKIPHAEMAFFEGGHRFLAQDPNANVAIESFFLSTS